MTTGTVKWFSSEKGYGFIEPADGGADVFVHITAVQAAGFDLLQANDRVSFEIERDKQRGKGRAIGLSLLPASD
jgi:cold shock protein